MSNNFSPSISVDSTQSMNETLPENPRMLNRQQSQANLNDLKIGVVWVENFDDIANFPSEALLSDSDQGLKDVVLIFVYVMSNELLKVKILGSQAKPVLPLMNDMVMPRKCLGPLVRQTVVNLTDRRRLNFDSHQPPLVRRRLLIQEIRHKYSSNLQEADLFTDLFTEN